MILNMVVAIFTSAHEEVMAAATVTVMANQVLLNIRERGWCRSLMYTPGLC